MEEILNFLIEIEKLKKMPRTGWILIGIKNPESIAEHIFHEAIMAWVLARQRKNNLNVDKVVKIALIHDLCEIYAGDITPYDEILPKNKKEWPELFDKWPRASEKKKIKTFLKKYKKERKSLEKLISKLPSEIKKEILNLWLDYELGLTKEGRFTKQVGRLTTLLQALLYGKKTKQRVYRSWWIGTKERIDDPLLIDFIKQLEKKFHPKHK
ncbi:MAG: HD domain-containing protein [Patescibacteria group bacterium]|nr:HD domain-containing protein [Patescibacteria group bacterium]